MESWASLDSPDQGYCVQEQSSFQGEREREGGRQKGLGVDGLSIPDSCLLRATAEITGVRGPLSQDGGGRWGDRCVCVCRGGGKQGNPSRNSLPLKKWQESSVTPGCAPRGSLRWTPRHPLAEEPRHFEGHMMWVTAKSF